jgi:hypothetical protein
MSSKGFFLIAGAVFGIVAIAHLLRIFMALSVTIGQWIVPMWASWVAVLVAGGLSFIALRLAKTALNPQP